MYIWQTHLLDMNGKTAQFKILPKYKIHSEGDYVSYNI